MSLRPASSAPARASTPHQLELLQALPASPEWPVRSSLRARRISARVFRDGRVEIVVPLRARAPDVARFVSQHRAWIERARQRALRALPGGVAALRVLPVADISLPALDETWTLHHQAAAGSARLRWAPHALQLRAAPADQEGMRAVLVRWLRERMRVTAERLLPPLAANMDVDYATVRIGCQRSRWGSCSRRGTVSLNCCLLFQRPEVLRYLLVHELAHRRHMNHGARFWRVVERHEPQWRQLDRELSAGWRQVPGWIFLRSGGAM